MWGEDNNEDDPDAILQQLEAYALPQKNKRVAHFKLSQRIQQEDESFDNFIKDLRLLAMDCAFADNDDSLVDSIIRGVHHQRCKNGC